MKCPGCIGFRSNIPIVFGKQGMHYFACAVFRYWLIRISGILSRSEHKTLTTKTKYYKGVAFRSGEQCIVLDSAYSKQDMPIRTSKQDMVAMP